MAETGASQGLEGPPSTPSMRDLRVSTFAGGAAVSWAGGASHGGAGAAAAAPRALRVARVARGAAVWPCALLRAAGGRVYFKTPARYELLA